MAIAALLLWMFTAAAGGYLLASRARPAGDEDEPAPRREPVLQAAEPAEAAQAPEAAEPQPRRPRDRFDPPSLARAKAEPIPGVRALAEFAHPALAITGLAFWILYVMSRDRVFAAIGLGILAGAICAGVSLFTANNRIVRRGRRDALFVSARLLVLHGAGAALTLLLTALIAARV